MPRVVLAWDRFIRFHISAACKPASRIRWMVPIAAYQAQAQADKGAGGREKAAHGIYDDPSSMEWRWGCSCSHASSVPPRTAAGPHTSAFCHGARSPHHLSLSPFELSSSSRRPVVHPLLLQPASLKQRPRCSSTVAADALDDHGSEQEICMLVDP